MAASAPAGPGRSDQVMPDQPRPAGATRRTIAPEISTRAAAPSAWVRRRTCSSNTARSTASSIPADHHPGRGSATGLRRGLPADGPGHVRQAKMQFCGRGESSISTWLKPASASIWPARSVPHMAPSPAPPPARPTGVQYMRLIA